MSNVVAIANIIMGLQSASDIQAVVCPVRLTFVTGADVFSSLPIDNILDKVISLTAAADIYDPRHPFSSRKHITFMEEAINMTVIQGFMGPSCNGLFVPAGRKTQHSVITCIRCLTADCKTLHVFEMLLSGIHLLSV